MTVVEENGEFTISAIHWAKNPTVVMTVNYNQA